jgi:DnaJ family protein C protein 2
MEQQNRRLKAPLLKNEKLRLNKLVNLAYSHDPRIQGMIAKQEEEKQARKREKQAQKEAKRVEEQAKIEKIKEEQRLKEEEAREKEQREKDQLINRKKQRRENEKRFRQTFKEKVSDPKYDDYYIDEIFAKMHDDDFGYLFDYLESVIKLDVAVLDKQLQELKQQRLKGETITKPLVEKVIEDKPELEWTTQELSLLTKGVAKYPAGTQDRWNRIAFYIGGRFSESQVLEKAKALKSKHKNELSVKIPNYVNPKVEPVKTETAPRPPSPAKAEPKEQNPVLDWTQDQQLQLEKAMKKYPGTLPAKERWEKIASEVEGKTMKDCVERFKWIKEKLKSNN